MSITHAPEEETRKPESDFRLVQCAIYTRVSTAEQAKEEHHSLGAQEEYCLGEIKRRQQEGWVHRITLSDPGYSGATFERPGLLELIRLAKAGKIQVVVVYKRERLFRDVRIASKVQAIFDAAGVRILSHVEGMHDGSPHAVFMRHIVDAYSENERATIKLRVVDAIRFAAKKGQWKGGVPPYGYAYVKGSKTLTPNPAEASVVKFIFSRISEGLSVFEVVAELRRLRIFGRLRTKRLVARS